LSLCLTKHRAVKTYWGSGGIASRILDHGIPIIYLDKASLERCHYANLLDVCLITFISAPLLSLLSYSWVISCISISSSDVDKSAFGESYRLSNK